MDSGLDRWRLFSRARRSSSVFGAPAALAGCCLFAMALLDGYIRDAEQVMDRLWRDGFDLGSQVVFREDRSLTPDDVTQIRSLLHDVGVAPEAVRAHATVAGTVRMGTRVLPFIGLSAEASRPFSSGDSAAVELAEGLSQALSCRHGSISSCVGRRVILSVSDSQGRGRTVEAIVSGERRGLFQEMDRSVIWMGAAMAAALNESGNSDLVSIDVPSREVQARVGEEMLSSGFKMVPWLLHPSADLFRRSKSYLLNYAGIVAGAMAVFCGLISFIASRSAAQRRRREVGLRLAVGFSRGRVLSRFILEYLVLLGLACSAAGAAAWLVADGVTAWKISYRGLALTDPILFGIQLSISDMCYRFWQFSTLAIVGHAAAACRLIWLPLPRLLSV